MSKSYILKIFTFGWELNCFISVTIMWLDWVVTFWLDTVSVVWFNSQEKIAVHVVRLASELMDQHKVETL